ncbi:hypothetical protein CPB86DRAFT_806709 [Serendipita vermifera]|nr:hypothetical protein CPB86DRAFT_806709 [Serendipita vermifera]
MSEPRDHRVVPSAQSAQAAQVGVTRASSTSSPPQVTLEPLTSFKRSLEEIGFDTGPGDEPAHPASGPHQANTSPSEQRSNIPAGTHRRSESNSEVIVVSETSLPTSTPSADQSTSGTTHRRIMLARSRELTTPPLLPPIDSQSHLLELITSFSGTPSEQAGIPGRIISPINDATDSSSTSETEIFLSSSRRPEPVRLTSSEMHTRLRNGASSSESSTQTPTNPVTRRLLRNIPSRRNPNATSDNQNVRPLRTTTTRAPIFSSEGPVASNRSPELPPIDTSDNGLAQLTNLLYNNDQPGPLNGMEMRPHPSAGRIGRPDRNPAALSHSLENVSRSATYIPSRPFVESPSPPIGSPAAPVTATIASTLTSHWDEMSARIRNFDEAIAPLRRTPPPSLQLPSQLRGSYPPTLPHPFEEATSPSVANDNDDIARDYFWETTRNAYRDELRYIHNLNSVLDEREMEGEELTPVLSIPMLPPIASSPLLVVDEGFQLSAAGASGADGEEETEWEADEVPSAWLREARRNLARPVTGESFSRDSSAPLLELPNFSSSSLGLVDFPGGTDDNQWPTPSPINTHPLSSRISTEQLRQLPTEHLRQLRRFALRSVTARSRSRSSIAPSVLSTESEGNGNPGVRPQSVVSNEDIIVGVPPMLDEPFDRSVWRALEDRMPETQQQNNLQPHANNDATLNASVRSAVSSPSVGGTEAERVSEAELGTWREQLHQLVEGSLSSRTVPTLALSPPPVGFAASDVLNRSGSRLHQRFPRVIPQHARPASVGEGSNASSNLDFRQTLADRRENRLSTAGRANSLAVAVSEMGSNQSFRAPSVPTVNVEPSPQLSDILLFTPGARQQQETPSPRGTEAFRMLDDYWSNSTTAAVRGITREMEFMERYIMERRNDSPRVHRRSFSPLWDTDDPLSDFLSDVGFDGSYEALLELGEQLGVVSRGIPDAAFAKLPTCIFKDLGPEILAMSPTQSIASSFSHAEDVDLPMSPTSPSTTTTTKFTAVKRQKPGKWVAQCSICLDEFATEDVCITLECTHFFHQPCVREWFRSASTCPLCRYPVPRA